MEAVVLAADMECPPPRRRSASRMREPRRNAGNAHALHAGSLICCRPRLARAVRNSVTCRARPASRASACTATRSSAAGSPGVRRFMHPDITTGLPDSATATRSSRPPLPAEPRRPSGPFPTLGQPGPDHQARGHGRCRGPHRRRRTHAGLARTRPGRRSPGRSAKRRESPDRQPHGYKQGREPGQVVAADQGRELRAPETPWRASS